MSGITAILDNASRALLAELLGVEVTGHKIANVDTPGFSRQTVDYVTATPVPSPYGPVGTGVKVQGIERAFDPFITSQLNEKSSLLSDYQTRSSALEQVATYFNETQDGASMISCQNSYRPGRIWPTTPPGPENSRPF